VAASPSVLIENEVHCQVFLKNVAARLFSRDRKTIPNSFASHSTGGAPAGRSIGRLGLRGDAATVGEPPAEKNLEEGHE
jgi:hypothetical protein